MDLFKYRYILTFPRRYYWLVVTLIVVFGILTVACAYAQQHNYLQIEKNKMFKKKNLLLVRYSLFPIQKDGSSIYYYNTRLTLYVLPMIVHRRQVGPPVRMHTCWLISQLFDRENRTTARSYTAGIFKTMTIEVDNPQRALGLFLSNVTTRRVSEK